MNKSDMIIGDIWPTVLAKRVFDKLLKILKNITKPAGVHRKHTKEVPLSLNKQPLEDEQEENVVTTSDIFMRIERHNNANSNTYMNPCCDNSLSLGYTNIKTNAAQYYTCRDGGVLEMRG